MIGHDGALVIDNDGRLGDWSGGELWHFVMMQGLVTCQVGSFGDWS